MLQLQICNKLKRPAQWRPKPFVPLPVCSLFLFWWTANRQKINFQESWGSLVVRLIWSVCQREKTDNYRSVPVLSFKRKSIKITYAEITFGLPDKRSSWYELIFDMLDGNWRNISLQIILSLGISEGKKSQMKWFTWFAQFQYFVFSSFSSGKEEFCLKFDVSNLWLPSFVFRRKICFSYTARTTGAKGTRRSARTVASRCTTRGAHTHTHVRAHTNEAVTRRPHQMKLEQLVTSKLLLQIY